MKNCLILVAFLGFACTKQRGSSQAVAPPLPPAPSIQQLVDVKVANVTITPQAPRIDQSATVAAEVRGAPAGTELTLAWFGPDGWLVDDQMQQVTGNSVKFNVPSHTFRKPGQYHGSIRADVIHLADVSLSVAG